MKNSFFNSLLGFTPYWDYNLTNTILVDRPGVEASEKISNLTTIEENQLKCDVFDGSVVNGLRQPIHFSFVSEKLPGNRVFCEPQRTLYKKNKFCFQYCNILFTS